MSEAHFDWMTRYAAELKAARRGAPPVVCLNCSRLIRPTVCPRCGAFNACTPPSALDLSLLCLLDAPAPLTERLLKVI